MTAWTDERVAVLKKLAADGLSAREIAGELGGVSRSAVIGKADRLGLQLSGSCGRPRSAQPEAKKPDAEFLQKLAKERATATAPPPPLVVETLDLPPDQSSFAVPLMKSTDDHCKWPLNEPTACMLVCGATVVSKPYCARHARIAYPRWTG